MNKPHIYKAKLPVMWYCSIKNENGYVSGCGYTAEEAYKDYLRIKDKFEHIKIHGNYEHPKHH